MNRMEAGGETGGDRNQGVPGVTGQANPGAAMHGYTASDWNDTCPELSGGAGTLVGNGTCKCECECKRTKCLSATVGFTMFRLRTS